MHPQPLLEPDALQCMFHAPQQGYRGPDSGLHTERRKCRWSGVLGAGRTPPRDPWRLVTILHLPRSPSVQTLVLTLWQMLVHDRRRRASGRAPSRSLHPLCSADQTSNDDLIFSSSLTAWLIPSSLVPRKKQRHLRRRSASSCRRIKLQSPTVSVTSEHTTLACERATTRRRRVISAV